MRSDRAAQGPALQTAHSCPSNCTLERHRGFRGPIRAPPSGGYTKVEPGPRDLPPCTPPSYHRLSLSLSLSLSALTVAARWRGRRGQRGRYGRDGGLRHARRRQGRLLSHRQPGALQEPWDATEPRLEDERGLGLSAPVAAVYCAPPLGDLGARQFTNRS
eukprot:scaffold58426_cov32-Phaeocystis_antarctica.AAC.1